jgi:tetratricopeptide (TPR) repeat protein
VSRGVTWTILLALFFTLPIEGAVGVTRFLLVARDLENHPLAGFTFAFGGFESKPTHNKTGATELDLPSGLQPGQQIKILLAPSSKRSAEWFLVNSELNIPTRSDSAEVVLMRRSAFRQVASEVIDAPAAKALGSYESTGADRKRDLVAAAARHGLTAEQLESAIRSFADTQDPKDRGIAAYLEGKFSQAEEILSGPTKNKERDLVETLRYLGAAQYEQGKYREAADSFRKAVALRGEDVDLLSWLGNSLRKLDEWIEAEPILRKVLAMEESTYGLEHYHVANALQNLALLLQTTNRLAEAETLMRRSLSITEKTYGPEHTYTATSLNNLALLLKAMGHHP